MAQVRLTLDTALQARGMTRYELAKQTEIRYQIIDNYYKNKVGQSSRLITGRSKVRALDGPPKKHFAYAKCFFRISRRAAFEGI